MREEGSMDLGENETMMRMDELELGIRAVIDTHGWAGMAIFDPANQRASWFYTVGVTTLGHPELVIFGLPPEVAHGVADTAIAQIRDGGRYEPGTTYDDILEDGFAVAVVKVDEPGHDEYPLGMARRIYGSDVEAVQLVWPGDDGLFPWSGTTNPRCRDQRLFGTWQGGVA
jgi:hypothetical protein